VTTSIRKILGQSSLTKDDEFAYYHLWRYIGYLLGIKEENNPLSSISRAQGAAESIFAHLTNPDERSVELAHHVLATGAGRAPLYYSFVCQAEAARLLLGHPLSDALELPRSFVHAIYWWAVAYFFCFLHYFISPWIFTARKVSKGLRGLLTQSLELCKAPSQSGLPSSSGCPFDTSGSGVCPYRY
jgi:hypothetical protein